MKLTNAERCKRYRERKAGKVVSQFTWTNTRRLDLHQKRLEELERKLEALEKKVQEDPFRL
jgi:hypothetical protein